MEYKIYFAKDYDNEYSPIYVGVALSKESFFEYLRETYPELKSIYLIDEKLFVVGEIYQIYPYL